jgi:hypothetical protein
LYGQDLTAFAACAGCDRVVFRLSDGTWAIVHLTWTSNQPDAPPWPSTQRFGGLKAIETGMDQHEH